ncbi:hypothetical protein BDV96DRAFT_694476 [Lophiotrema nucula]|uniref:Uncharacterized protein n=1 Tax=Lophiotrema nucula TaxID=690887 RepID=A0A6A5YGB4_9PLEO|nr:hypothetical protein BDV96DRAFT_694476 [Lophiotrema nucula]
MADHGESVAGANAPNAGGDVNPTQQASAQQVGKDTSNYERYSKQRADEFHEHKEKQHEKREAEREGILSGRIKPPPGAGPNWAKNKLAQLNKYAKATNRRHKKHEENMKAEAESNAIRW